MIVSRKKICWIISFSSFSSSPSTGLYIAQKMSNIEEVRDYIIKAFSIFAREQKDN